MEIMVIPSLDLPSMHEFTHIVVDESDSHLLTIQIILYTPFCIYSTYIYVS
jgi:hypothetical protein